MIGATPPNISELTRSSERLSYIYVEHATIHRADNAITVTEERGITHIPAASLSALLLGPGTRITHQAMTCLLYTSPGPRDPKTSRMPSSA